jgi:anti-sigma-K factor RskA
MTDHEHWDELAAGYVLHGLSPDDQASFVNHLETCARCQESVNEHELVTAQLGAIAHHQEPEDAPSWESMRDAIIGSKHLPLPASAEVADLTARRRRYNVSRRVLAAAAAVVVVAGGGIATWRIASGGSSCSASAGCHEIKLDAAGGKTLASLVVHNNTVTVTPTNMPAAPAGKVYVLWQQPRNGRATPLSEFKAAPGAAAPTGALTAPYSDTEAFAVSLEPAASGPPVSPSNTLASGTAT